jgi:hypothetical protein
MTTDVKMVNQSPPSQIIMRIPGIPRVFTNILDDKVSAMSRKK